MGTKLIIFVACLAGMCHAQLIVLQNQHKRGGTFQSAGGSLAACLQSCIDSPTCLGIDFNNNGNTCWLHDSTSVCSTPISKASCLHFTFTNQCPNLPASPQGVTLLSGMHIRGGELQGFSLTVDDCLLRCALRGDCFGFDFDTNGNSCWLHTATSECGTQVSKATCSHYRFVDCVLFDPTEGTTIRPNTAPSLAVFESFPGMHIAQGTQRRGISSAADCLQLCWSEASCQGFDFNAAALQCWTHETSECNPLQSKAFCTHYRVKASCMAASLAACTNVTYTTIVSARRVDGPRVAKDTTLAQCQQLCTNKPSCVATDFKILGGECFYFNYTGIPTTDACCTHSIKACADNTVGVGPTTGMPATTVAPTPTAAPTTTMMPLIGRPTPIPASGQCPDEYELTSMAYQPGGTQNSSVTTEEGCKQVCLDLGGACAAATFNSTGSACFIHASNNLTTFVRGDACCNHFRRLNCQVRQCYMHTAEDVTAFLFASTFNVSATLARLDVYTPLYNPPTGSCDGVCYTTITFAPVTPGSSDPLIFDTNLPATVERGCDTSPQEFVIKNCQVSILNATTDYRRMTCNCYGDRCNAFGILLNECIGYYPMDGNANDLSFGRRDGIDINVKYDGFTMQKNYSAFFDGTSRIKLQQFANFLTGRVDPSTGITQPGYTVTMWIYRFFQSNTHYIFSNGGSFEIYSVPDGTGTMHMIQWDVKMNGVLYSVTSMPIPYSSWFWLAAVVNDNNVNYTLDLYIDDTTTPNVTLDTGIPFTATGPAPQIDIQSIPICIGDRSVSRNQIFQDDPSVSPFFGYVDELWMFARSVGALNSVKEHSTSTGLFLP